MKYAIIGVGNMGKNHARAVHELGLTELVGVADASTQTVNTIAKLYNCKAFDDYIQMLDECEIDAVSICVPTTLHFSVAMECLRRGKHVLLEKPITPTVEEGLELQAFAKEQGVQLMIGHI